MIIDLKEYHKLSKQIGESTDIFAILQMITALDMVVDFVLDERDKRIKLEQRIKDLEGALNE